MLAEICKPTLIVTCCHIGPLRSQVLQEALTLAASPKEGSGESWFAAACLYGGVPFYHQVRLLDKGVHLLVATPGRLRDLLA